MKAYIIFELDGRRYEYDGGLPASLAEPYAAAFRGYPADLGEAGADARDELPTARWEIELLGGRILSIHGAQPNGAIHWEDWKNPRVY